MAGNGTDLDLTEYNGDSLLVTAAVFLGISWISVILRTYTRAILTKSFQLDDWFMLASQLVFTASCVFILRGVRSGMGRHNLAIEDDADEVDALMWQALATASYVLNMMLIKLSIGFFLLRLATQKVYIWILRVSLGVIVIWSMVLFIWNLFQCNPVEKQWDWRIDHGHCVSADQIVQAAYALSVMCVLSDWLFAILPIPMLWSVKMTKQAKATVIVILGLGIFIATLIRLRFLADLEDMEDILYAGTDAMVWTLIEPGIAIVAASMATIRPLLRRMRIRGFESTDRTGGSNSNWTSSRRSTKRSKAGGSKSVISAVRGEEEEGAVVVVMQDLDDKRSVKTSNTGLLAAPSSFTNLNKSLPSIPENRRSGMSQIYSIPVDKSTQDWTAEGTSVASTRSFEQIHDLEAQNQDGGLELSDASKR